jgi:hypothetical protein
MSDRRIAMKRRDKKRPKEDSLNEAPAQPDGVRRPSEGGVGSEYSRGPGTGDSSPTSKTKL